MEDVLAYLMVLCHKQIIFRIVIIQIQLYSEWKVEKFQRADSYGSENKLVYK